MEQVASDDVNMDQVFASAHYYFPILICTRKEQHKKPGELQYEAVGIPFLLELETDSKNGTVAPLHYENVERPIRLEAPKAGHQCTQYYHGQCFNALVKMMCMLDVKGVKNLLECHKDAADEWLPIKCTCGKAHHSNSIVVARDCFGANALNTAVRVVTQLEGSDKEKGREICTQLLGYGANPNLVPSNQLACLDIAVEDGDMKLMKILVKGGAFITTCVERIAKLRLQSQTHSKKKYKTSVHEGFDIARLEVLLSEEVVMCAPDPLVSSFYVCVVLKRLRERHHTFNGELKSLQQRLERITYHYLDLCSNGWEARTLVTKEVLSSVGGPRIPLYEYAVMCEQKHFCSHKHIQHLASGMWHGSSYNTESYVEVTKRFISAILINVAFPILLYNQHITQKERSPYSWEDKVYSLVRIPSVCFAVDITNHIILAALFIYSCTQDGFAFTYVEVIVWLACLARLMIEYDYIRVQGVKRYFKDLSNLVNIVVGCSFVLIAIARIVAEALPSDLTLSVKLISITRYLYALGASGMLMKLLTMFQINKTLGPLTTTIVKMCEDFFTFLILLALTIVMFSIPLYAVSYQSFKAYQYEASQSNASAINHTLNVYFDTYPNTISFLGFSIFGYGATYAGDIDYDSFSSMIMNGLYLIYLVALVILLLNLLIAVLNTTYTGCIENATREWKFSRVQQLLKYRGVQPFMFPFILYLYPLYKLTVYSSRYITDRDSTVRREMYSNIARDENYNETIRQNFYLHRVLKQKYRDRKMGSDRS